MPKIQIKKYSKYQQYLMSKIITLTCLVLLLSISSKCQSDDSDILNGEAQFDTPNKKLEDQPTINQTSTSTQQKLPRREFKFDLNTLNQYRWEALAVVGILVYLVMYRKGKAQNIELMEIFYKKVRNYVDTNFSHIGFTKNSGEDPFVAESPNQAMFYASGRENVDYLEIKFNMLKRQDLLYHLVYETIYPEKDLITIDIALSSSQPIVFCLANKKKLKHVTEANIDIAKLAGSFDVKGLNPTFHALCQSSEILDSILDQNTCKKLNDLTSLIHSIHYTDQKLFSESEGHLRAVFFASEKHSDKYLPALELLFNLVDKIKDMKISASYKAKSFKARQSFNASIQKQKLQKHKEELRKKKEQKRKQEEAWLRSLPPEKQKREDEKRKKKQINKLLKSRVMKA